MAPEKKNGMTSAGTFHRGRVRRGRTYRMITTCKYAYARGFLTGRGNHASCMASYMDRQLASLLAHGGGALCVCVHPNVGLGDETAKCR
jgi:hypothetical protein